MHYIQLIVLPNVNVFVRYRKLLCYDMYTYNTYIVSYHLNINHRFIEHKFRALGRTIRYHYKYILMYFLSSDLLIYYHTSPEVLQIVPDNKKWVTHLNELFYSGSRKV